MDIDSIPIGQDFRRAIDAALESVRIALVIIGEQWLDCRHPSGPRKGERRIDDDDDLVRLEVETALAKDITVIPVLVGEATMPAGDQLPAALAPLALRNATEVRSGPDFRLHMQRLTSAIGAYVGRVAPTPDVRAEPMKVVATAIPASFDELKTDPRALIGRRVGPYAVTSFIDSGGSGWVFAAQNVRRGNKTCIKLLFPLQASVASVRRPMARGIRGLSALDHPGIVKVYEFDATRLRDGESFYIAMELIDGPDLDEWIRRLPEGDEGRRKKLQVAKALAEALDTAHNARFLDETGFEARGILHGDIKPSNVLMRGDQPVLVDFMIADVQRLIDGPGAQATDAGVPITGAFGTVTFMAPEQAQDGVVTVRSDIFSLGRTMSALGFGQDRPLLVLIDRMCQPNPDRRPASMREVVDAIAVELERAPPTETVPPELGPSPTADAAANPSTAKPGLLSHLRRWFGGE